MLQDNLNSRPKIAEVMSHIDALIKPLLVGTQRARWVKHDENEIAGMLRSFFSFVRRLDYQSPSLHLGFELIILPSLCCLAFCYLCSHIPLSVDCVVYTGCILTLDIKQFQI
jgi:hypothetical protein